MTANQLKVFRKGLGLTQKALAAELGYTREAVNMMEMGIRPIHKVVELALETVARNLTTKKAAGQ